MAGAGYKLSFGLYVHKVVTISSSKIATDSVSHWHATMSRLPCWRWQCLKMHQTHPASQMEQVGICNSQLQLNVSDLMLTATVLTINLQLIYLERRMTFYELGWRRLHSEPHTYYRFLATSLFYRGENRKNNWTSLLPLSLGDYNIKKNVLVMYDVISLCKCQPTWRICLV